MSIRITIEDEQSRKHDYFFKTTGKHLKNVPRGSCTKECRLDVDIQYNNDIDNIREFLCNLEVSLNQNKDE